MFGKRSAIFKQERSQEREKRVSITHEQNSICSQKLNQKQLNDIAREHTIICRQLFAGHVVGSRPMKRKKHLHRMIIDLLTTDKSVSFAHLVQFKVDRLQIMVVAKNIYLRVPTVHQYRDA